TNRGTHAPMEGFYPRVSALREAGFRVAVEDVGAGHAGLPAFMEMRPDMVKLDAELVRGIESDPLKRGVVRAMTGLCEELGVPLVAEGVQTAGERDALSALG